MNRGRRGESVFLEKQDYSMFVELLKEVVDMYTNRGMLPFFLLGDLEDRNLKRLGDSLVSPSTAL